MGRRALLARKDAVVRVETRARACSHLNCVVWCGVVCLVGAREA